MSQSGYMFPDVILTELFVHVYCGRVLFGKQSFPYPASKFKKWPASHLSRTIRVCQRTKQSKWPWKPKLWVCEPESKATDKQSRLNIHSIGDRAKYDMYIAQSARARETLISFLSPMLPFSRQNAFRKPTASVNISTIYVAFKNMLCIKNAFLL